MASLCKLAVHNELIKCPVQGCADGVYRYNMEQHMKVGEDHSKFEVPPREQGMRRRSPADQRAFEGRQNRQQCNPKGSTCC